MHFTNFSSINRHIVISGRKTCRPRRRIVISSRREDKVFHRGENWIRVEGNRLGNGTRWISKNWLFGLQTAHISMMFSSEKGNGSIRGKLDFPRKCGSIREKISGLLLLLISIKNNADFCQSEKFVRVEECLV